MGRATPRCFSPLVGEMVGRPEGETASTLPKPTLHCTEQAVPANSHKTASHFCWNYSKFRTTASKGIIRVSNVVEFRKPHKPKEPKKVPPGLRKVLIVAGVIAVFVLVWAWFNFFGG